MLSASFVSINRVLEANESLGLHEVYIGNIYAAANLGLLQELSIQAVLTVANATRLTYPKSANIRHLIVDAIDLPSFNLKEHFPRCTEFIDSQRSRCNVLVHCMAGISRSSSAVLAYCIEYLKMPLKRAFDMIKERRPIICPNIGFIRQL
jgi:protein-tyrosine phosphatase